MKIRCSKEKLLKAINTVQNAVGTKTTLPILSNILLEATKDTLKLVATDLEIGIWSIIPTDVAQEGSITIPAKRFSDIIKELPESIINLQAKKNNVITIDCEQSFFRLIGLPKEEFPKLPEISSDRSFSMPQTDLKRMLEMTAFAVSHEETRYVLNGALFVINERGLRIVATDGRRLAMIEKTIQIPKNLNTKIIVPAKTVAELLRNLEGQEEAKLVLGDNQVLFDLGNTVMVSRLIEGEFPNYEQVIPSKAKNTIKIDTNKLLLATRRASILTSQESPSIKIDLARDKMVVSKERAEIGEAKEEIGIGYSGNEFSIGFNPAYLIDALKTISQEKVDLELTDPEKAGVIRSEDNYVYIVLPMKLV